ncbi:ABC1-domain-containing protein [Suhomyces tanzawaensis NRRL Y-17324]|uniref:ABC1-domain-containing protein n=1 Tax=Suhomyces tanzawaensis NRRL Y-17324 TaxID=984487 RepID=A0A1E4SH41_9ASCO|nr:ABC1-domain-containing protein [Suhomyces tanzawaensis NRRL Y-17324]ODV78806.1 ABC1-domain-containing protein [Suhomyces tanzawaensis NRRL Y-17324]
MFPARLACGTRLRPPARACWRSLVPTPKLTLFKVGIAIGVAGLVLYATNDTAKHVILTTERIGVVTAATARCFLLYKDVLGKEFSSKAERTAELNKTHQKAAEITLRALEKNGGIYIKLGQHITALTYLLPKEWTDTMLPLQDRCPRSSLEEIEQLFIKDMGKPMSELFSSFDPEPVGVASLAQVHIATLKETGEKVAVKIQHPTLQEFVPLDIYLTKTVFNLMYRFFPEYPLTWLGEEMQASIYVELDFTNEAENARKTAQYFQNFTRETALRIPTIVAAQKRVLIMEYVAGSRLDNLEYLNQHNIHPHEVSSCLSHIFNNMIFTPDVGLHCDPHGGNLAIRSVDKRTSPSGHNFEIVLYDHGLYRQIPLQMKREYSHFWLSVLDGDVPKMKEYAGKFAGIEGDQKFRIFAAAITGRSPENALNYDISKARSTDEIKNIQSQLLSTDGILEDLMYILSSMPRIVLLILKTNDLTRNLDESLSNPLGPERTFLIMANYCAKVVYDESKERIAATYSKYSVRATLEYARTWWAYQRRISTLYIYDFIMMVRNLRHQFLS